MNRKLDAIAIGLDLILWTNQDQLITIVPLLKIRQIELPLRLTLSSLDNLIISD